MKTKFSVDIHGNGDANDAILRMITNHNAGNVVIDLSIISAYLKAAFAQYPSITPEFGIVEDVNERTLHISENGKQTLSLTLHTHVGSIDENNNVTEHQNY